jgi:ADP-ribosylglycohydrolase
MRLTWVQPEDLLPHQLIRSRSEGVEVADVEARWLDAGGMTDAPVSGASATPAGDDLRALARELLDELDSRTPGFAEAQIPQLEPLTGSADVAARVLGGWTGRAAGCLLGKPVEKIPREGIREILETSGQWPLRRYITAQGVPDEVQARWPWNRRSKTTSLREVIDRMPENDDLNFSEALDQLHASYGHFHWVHSVNNSALVAYALTAPDFATGIGVAVMGGWDTDSVGATVGAVLGTVYGVPPEWSGLLDNQVATSLPGLNQIAIDELSARTLEVGQR